MNGRWTHSLQLDRPTYAPASHTMAFTPQCSPATAHYLFLANSYFWLLFNWSAARTCS